MGAARFRVLADAAAPNAHAPGGRRYKTQLPPLRLPQAGVVDLCLLERLRTSRAVSARAVSAARTAHLRHGMPVERHLYANGAMSESELLGELSAALGCALHSAVIPADAAALDRLGAEFCLTSGLVPMRRVGGATLIATARPATARALLGHLTATLGPVRFVLARTAAVEAAILAVRRPVLTDHAERCVAAGESCRGWSETALFRTGLGIALAVVALAALFPLALFAALALWTVATLAATVVLKIAAARAAFQPPEAPQPEAAFRRPPPPRPVVSILVPLFREREIAGRLITRLDRLTYPRAALDICLVVEEDDAVTRAALTAAPLPRHMRIVPVPRGVIKTKPRALNYALPFCRGEIVGIYDAEDAPAADQIERVVARFAKAPPEVACLQGVLDFYNISENWLSRLFTVEYNTWFRLVLPGLARLGLVVPLGGTTLFFRRKALERLGAWDAHNVTEDADLGLRLARHGYRTELIDTVTGEEANCRPWPWIRQRSRWLKGYAMTWAAHMRRPLRLWRDLGPRRFLGVQILFLGTLTQYLFAPLLWSFWVLPFGLPHPLGPILGPVGLALCALLFFVSEAINLILGIAAVRRAGHPWLGWWVPTMHLYFPMGVVAAWKGIIEIATRPYYWDKTAHGLSVDPAPEVPAE